jgi:hypothetical protein
VTSMGSRNESVTQRNESVTESVTSMRALRLHHLSSARQSSVWQGEGGGHIRMSSERRKACASRRFPERRKACASRRFPDFDNLVVAAAGDKLAVGRKSHRPDPGL